MEDVHHGRIDRETETEGAMAGSAGNAENGNAEKRGEEEERIDGVGDDVLLRGG